MWEVSAFALVDSSSLDGVGMTVNGCCTAVRPLESRQTLDVVRQLYIKRSFASGIQGETVLVQLHRRRRVPIDGDDATG